MSYSNQFSYSIEVLSDFQKNKLYNEKLKEYLFVLMQIARGTYGSAVNQFDIECYQFHLELLHDDLVSIDKERFSQDLLLLQKKL